MMISIFDRNHLQCGVLFAMLSGAGSLALAQDELIFADDFDRMFIDCLDCPELVLIPAGTFVQGSPPDEPQRSATEGPQRTVTVPTFAVSRTEITFADWDACVADGGCNHNPDDSTWGRGDRPVMNVSWNDVQEYLAWLSSKSGKAYRLPSESEWEYATRAGSTGRFNTGDCITTDQANFDGLSPAVGCPTGAFPFETVPVKSYAENVFGLYDTHGNVWEWVPDCWNSSYDGAPIDGSAWNAGDCNRGVLRGGSFNDVGQNLRSANRSWAPRDFRGNFIGFRIARTISP